jgi:hypothetical protein
VDDKDREKMDEVVDEDNVGDGKVYISIIKPVSINTSTLKMCKLIDGRVNIVDIDVDKHSENDSDNEKEELFLDGVNKIYLLIKRFILFSAFIRDKKKKRQTDETIENN